MTPHALAAGAGTASPRHFWLVAGLLAVATALCFLLEDLLSVTSQAMVYVLVVVIVSYATDLRAALVCSLAAVTLLNYFFIPPKFAFRIEADENVTALAAMFAVAVVISQTGAVLRRQALLARLNEARARLLQQLATELAGISAAAQVPVIAQRFLDRAFPGGCHAALLDPDGTLQFAGILPLHVQEAMRACVAAGAVRGPGSGRPQPPSWCLPLTFENRIEGAAYVPGSAVRDERDVEHAQAICALLGQALWRLKLGTSVQAAQESARWHRAQNTFLAGISHDFRTPLAAMVTAASSLQAQRDKLDLQTQQRLTQIILDEAGHLAVLTENTLQFARLENAGEIQRDWQAMEEIVGSVLARMRQRDWSGRIRSSVPAGLPLIQADPVLLAQLLDNLLDNALKYSQDQIDLVVSLGGEHMEVAVQDRGHGITPGDEDAVFEPYRRSDRSGHRGAGLGLAVCRAIARAHGGELELRRRDGGGSSFVLRLPVPAVQPYSEAAA
jgi:two-component system sensor histidine kinase KdpD